MAMTFSALAAAVLACASAAASGTPLEHATGLPAYPNMQTAKMDSRLRTETLGRQCVRFVATSEDPLAVVEAWYRKTLLHASETDLQNDAAYAALGPLQGIKLAQDLNYVSVYRLANLPTTIELHRCNWNRP